MPFQEKKICSHKRFFVPYVDNSLYNVFLIGYLGKSFNANCALSQVNIKANYTDNIVQHSKRLNGCPIMSTPPSLSTEVEATSSPPPHGMGEETEPSTQMIIGPPDCSFAAT